MTTPRSNLLDRPYHHGDLRRAIVAAALEVLHETQSIEFSLRELARRAGVSHNAPYKHFTDKRELLAAVSAAGFEALARRMGVEAKKSAHPRARLFAMLRAYIRYGVDNPALYKLMFGGFLSGPEDGRRAIAESARTLLAGVICDGALGRTISDAPRNERKIAGAILACWSLVHGLTQLIADEFVGPGMKCDELGDTLVKAMLDGLGTKCHTLPIGTWVGRKVQ